MHFLVIKTKTWVKYEASIIYLFAFFCYVTKYLHVFFLNHENIEKKVPFFHFIYQELYCNAKKNFQYRSGSSSL